MNPHQKLLIESIANKQRPGLVIILAPTVQEHSTHVHDGIEIEVLGGMPLDASIGQLELLKANMLNQYLAQKATDL